MKSARVYDFTLTAGGSFQLLVEGDYFRIMSSTGPVEIITDSMRLGPLRAGQGQEDEPFKRLTINDKSGAANVGTVLVASSGFIDQRINGEVSVIDGEKSRALAGGMYAANNYSGAAVAGQQPYTQLWNPAGSGKNLIVNQVNIAMTGAASVTVYVDTVKFPTVSAVANKKPSGAVGVGLACAQIIVGVPTYPLGALWGQFVQVNSPVNWSIKGAVIVEPGYGLNVFGSIANSSLLTNYEWFEEAI